MRRSLPSTTPWFPPIVAVLVATASCSGDDQSSPGGQQGGGAATTSGAGGSAGTAGGAMGGTGGSAIGGTGGSAAMGGTGGAPIGGTGGSAMGGTGGAAIGGTGGSGATGVGGAAGGSSGTGGTGGTGGSPDPGPADWPLINGIQWADAAGNPIQAHGGGLLEVDGYYYWFGENRNPDGTFYAVSAYRSRDLVRWEFVHDVLRENSGPGLDPANVERPKVVYNASTGKYVMWMHWENGSDYGEARAAVASSDTVAGDYTYHGSFRPLAGSGVMDHGKPGYMSRDCTLFVDDDGTAYFLSASNENYDLNLYELTPDYLQIARLTTVLFPGGHREAPAVFKRDGVYFLLTSGATGWSPNQASYATSRSMASGWSALSNVADGNTFYSQSTFVMPVRGSSGTSYLYLGDRWAGAWGGRVNDSSYVWQPISFPSATSMSMSWNNTLTIDTTAGSVVGATRTFQFVNVNSGKALDVAGASSADGAEIVQNAATGADSQGWSLNYDGAGYFRITNVNSGKILDVSDESTDDGIGLIQWQNHDRASCGAGRGPTPPP